MADTNLNIVYAFDPTLTIADRDLKVWNGSEWVGTYGNALYYFNGGSWLKIWEWWTPNPPIGSAVLLSQEFLSGGDMQASWTPADVNYNVQVEWRINSVSFGYAYESAGSSSSVLDESNFSNGDVVEARMKYYYDTYIGDWSDWSDTWTYYA